MCQKQIRYVGEEKSNVWQIQIRCGGNRNSMFASVRIFPAGASDGEVSGQGVTELCMAALRNSVHQEDNSSVVFVIFSFVEIIANLIK